MSPRINEMSFRVVSQLALERGEDSSIGQVNNLLDPALVKKSCLFT